MNTFLRFLDYAEQKFLFPIGRRVWQSAALLATGALALFIVFVLFNATPTKRPVVVVTKQEVIRKKMDTTALRPESLSPPSLSSAELMRMQSYMESRIAGLPNATLRFERFFTRQGMDKTDVLARFEAFIPIDSLMYFTDSTYLPYIYDSYLDFFLNQYLSPTEFERLNSLYKLLKPGKLFVRNYEDWRQFYQFCYDFRYLTPNDAEIEQVMLLKEATRDIRNQPGSEELYIKLAYHTFESSLPEKELAAAVSMFLKDRDAYKIMGIISSYRTFLNVYKNKFDYLNAKTELRKALKKSRLSEYGTYALMAFGLLMALSFLLLFFSIQRQLRT